MLNIGTLRAKCHSNLSFISFSRHSRVFGGPQGSGIYCCFYCYFIL